MLLFILVFIASLTIGLFLTMILFASITFKSTITQVILYTISSFIIGSGIIGLMVWNVKANKTLWNNGKCSRCNQELRLVDVSRHKFEVYYDYICDNCGNIVTLDMNPQEGY